MGVFRHPPFHRRHQRRRFFLSYDAPVVIEATATDGLDFGDSLTRQTIYRQTAADALDVAATLTPRRILRASVVESVGLSGTMARRADYRTTLADLMELLETAAGGSRFPASAADAVDLTESAAPGYIIRRAAADTWELLPAATHRAIYQGAAADAWELTGAADYPVPADSGELDLVPDEDSNQGSDTNINITNNEFAVRSANPYFALEFRDLDVPRNAIPSTSYLRFYVITNDDPGLTIRAEKSASPAALSTTAGDISSRTPLTTASVDWSAANIGVSAYKDTPSLNDVLAEVFAMGGWTRGSSDLVLILNDNGTGGYLRGGTKNHSDSAKRPHLIIEWYIGGLTITATAEDLIAVLDDAGRRAVVAAATGDALSLATATTTAISLLVADALELSAMVLTLARLSVGDALLIGDSVYLTYAMSLTEPVNFFEAVSRIAAMRAQSVDALDYIDAVRTTVQTAAGDALALTDALDARRILAGLATDTALYTLILTGDMAGILEAIATDAVDLSALALAGWRTGATAADALDYAETLAAVRRLQATAADAGAIGDVAALLKRARATATDAAGFADALRTLLRTRAGDAFDLTDTAAATVAVILYALAADVLELSEALSTGWTVTARDRLEFTAAVATIMHWYEEVADALELSGLAVFLLPNGIVRVQFSIKGATVHFDIAMPGATFELKQPRIDIEPHGLEDR